MASGSVTLTNDTIDNNLAGILVNGGTYLGVEYGYGSGIYIASGALVYLDSFTVTNTNWNWYGNAAAYPGIDGTYTLLS